MRVCPTCDEEVPYLESCGECADCCYQFCGIHYSFDRDDEADDWEDE